MYDCMEKVNLSIIKDNFSSRTDPSIFTSIATVLLDWLISALKSTSHFLPKSTLSLRFKFRSQFYLLPQIRCLTTFRVESSIISIDSNIKKVAVTWSGRSVMYSRKIVGPRMDPWGTPELTGYSCEDFPSRTTWSCLLMGKEEIRPNIWPETLYDLSLWRRPKICKNLLKALDISVLQLE